MLVGVIICRQGCDVHIKLANLGVIGELLGGLGRHWGLWGPRDDIGRDHGAANTLLDLDPKVHRWLHRDQGGSHRVADHNVGLKRAANVDQGRIDVEPCGSAYHCQAYPTALPLTHLRLICGHSDRCADEHQSTGQGTYGEEHRPSRPSGGAAAVQPHFREAKAAFRGHNRGFPDELDSAVSIGALAGSLEGLRAHLRRPALPQTAQQ